MTRVLCGEKETHRGHVLPIVSPYDDLEETSSGVKFVLAECFPAFVCLLCAGKGKAEVRQEAADVITVSNPTVYAGESGAVSQKSFRVQGLFID